MFFLFLFLFLFFLCHSRESGNPFFLFFFVIPAKLVLDPIGDKLRGNDTGEDMTRVGVRSDCLDGQVSRSALSPVNQSTSQPGPWGLLITFVAIRGKVWL